MGLDIYAGTLTRYYARNWKTSVQQWAEKNGFQVKMLDSDGNELPNTDLPDPEEVLQGMEHWRDWFLGAVWPDKEDPLKPWPEDNERPYYTDKPDFEALDALRLYAACLHFGEPLPQEFPKKGQLSDFPISQRLIGDDLRMCPSLFQYITCWLPLEPMFTTGASMPVGGQASISTTSLLKMELDMINRKGWQASEEEILEWRNTEGYPVEGEFQSGGHLAMDHYPKHFQYNTESLAKFAYSILYSAVQFSLEQQVPILLDF